MDKLRRDLDTSFHPLTLQFRDPTIERAFEFEYNRRKLPPIRIAIGIFIALVFLQALGGHYSTAGGPQELRDAWIASLYFRGATISAMAFVFWLTYRPIMIRHGQRIIMLGIVALYLIFLLTSHAFSHWILLTAARFNFSIVLVAVASGLLFRHAAPLAMLLAFGFIPLIFLFSDNPIPPAFLMFATALTMSWVAFVIERARRKMWAAERRLRDEKALTERLLLSVLPPSIAARMQGGETLIADSHQEATVVFADIVNFTPLSASMPAEALVEILDEIFAAFDEIADRYDLEKIKTIGDAYMMAAGLPSERGADPAHALDAALEMQTALARIAAARDIDIMMRAGVHIGPVVAGVIGRSKFVYDLWGDSVNIASRMESTAPNGGVQVTEAVHRRLGNQYRMTPRGEIEVKGKGLMRTWLLEPEGRAPRPPSSAGARQPTRAEIAPV